MQSSQKAALSDNLVSHEKRCEFQLAPTVAMIWSYPVEWYDVGVMTKGDIASMVQVPALKRDDQFDAIGESTSLKKGQPPSLPLKSQPEVCCQDVASVDLHFDEDHLKLIFEVRSKVANLKFRVEQLDRKVNLLFDLCSHQVRPRYAKEMASQILAFPDLTIPLPPCHKENLPGAMISDLEQSLIIAK
jgi:hypothetical protein